MLTINKLLTFRDFADLKVLTTDTASLENEITYAVMTEVPDVELFVQKGVFIVTTGMVFENNLNALYSFIDSLVYRVKASGIGIKKGRFLMEIPHEIIVYANQRGLPIIEIPNDRVLITLTARIQNIIDGKDDMTFALEIQKRFSNLLFQGAPLSLVIEKLAEVIGTSVFLVDPLFNLVERAGKLDEECFNELSDDIQKRDVKTINKKTFTYIKPNHEEEFQILIIPIKVYIHYYYYLIITEPNRIPYPISEFTMDQAAIVLSFILYKDIKINETKYSIAAEEFKNLVKHTSEANMDELKINEEADYRYSDYYSVFQVTEAKLIHQPYTTSYTTETMAIISEWFRNNIDKYLPKSKVIQYPLQNKLYILIQKRHHNLNAIFENIARELAPYFELVFCIGNAHATLNRIHLSYFQATHIYENIFKTKEYKLLNYMEELGITNLFQGIDPLTMVEFCKSILKDLAYPNESSLFDLRMTLKTYIACKYELKATADQLYIHRNTVRNRIQKCEMILGYPIDDPKYALNIHLALELSE